MSDPKRASLITVGAPNSAKNNVTKTLRLTINLDESNESKYPELNYKELVIVQERKKRVQNGKTAGLDPFSDNDDDVERVARKFEQKYSGKSTYGRKGRSKHDEFADIGAGYDENDSFIDNTDGYDEMIPPECDTLYGGFYINCGSLEFKQVPENQAAGSDGEPNQAGRRNKRRMLSSSSEEESSESSSESESQDEKETKAIANGAVHSHNTEHRKKKNKKSDKKKPNKIRRNDSSAATSGKQTSDDNVHGEGESADSRTSQSDSMTSKPAPSSENAVTSDSSRDIEGKVEVKIPQPVAQVLEDLESIVSRLLVDNPNTPAKELETKTEHHIARLERAICKCNADSRVRRVAWTKAARALNASRTKLMQRARTLCENDNVHSTQAAVIPAVIPAPAVTVTTNTSKRKFEESLDDVDYSNLTPDQREAKIVDTLNRLKELIEERKPAMMANYNAECARVQEERKKIQIACSGGGASAAVEKRLPKRRFPWCARARALLARLARLAAAAPPSASAANQAANGAALLQARALPLFPRGFVRMPTLLRQAGLNKDMKIEQDQKRQRTSSQPAINMNTQTPIQLSAIPEAIQFPSSLTVTTTVKNTVHEKADVTMANDEKDKKPNSCFGTILNPFSRPDVIVEPGEKKKESVIVEKSKEDNYVPPNSIGSITITPVPNNQQKNDKKLTNNAVTILEKQKEPLIRVKSPAALNEMAKKEKDKRDKKIEKAISNMKERKIDTPLHIDTNYQSNKAPTPSPKKAEELNQKKVETISQKKIESMRISENNIPRPALIPVSHSPTFAKPDKRPPEVKKKKDVMIVSDVDPLSDVHQEPVSVDDSSSDVELIEEKNIEKSDQKSDSVPSKDRVILHSNLNHKKMDSVKHSSKEQVTFSAKDGRVDSAKSDKLDEATKEDIDTVMRNLREMEHSQEATKYNSNSYGGVITSAKHERSSNHSRSIFGETQSDKNKFAE